MTAAGGFNIGVVVYWLCGPDWVVAALTEASAPVAAVLMGAPFGLGAAALAGLYLSRNYRAQARLLRDALNNMTQGFCMFDRAARLVRCNERYSAMYHLRPEHARVGTPLRELLLHRLAAGNFAGDVDRYVADCLKRVVEGRTEGKTNELKDGRVIAVVSRPMRTGGWLATHTDVTDQLAAEKERDSLRQRDERRRSTDAALSSSRARAKSVLKTVGDSATAIKAAAKTRLRLNPV